MTSELDKILALIKDPNINFDSKADIQAIFKKVEKEAKLLDFKNSRLQNEKGSISSLLRKVSEDFNQAYNLLEYKKKKLKINLQSSKNCLLR